MEDWTSRVVGADLLVGLGTLIGLMHKDNNTKMADMTPFPHSTKQLKFGSGAWTDR